MAASLYKRSADQGDAMGIANLGARYMVGPGIQYVFYIWQRRLRPCH